MNKNEEYFRFAKSGNVLILSNRIPFKWKELMIWSPLAFLFLLIWTTWFTALYIAILTTVGYTLYRFGAWMYYTEVSIDETSGKMIKVKKLLNSTQNEEIITERFDLSKFEFTELTRTGKTKYLLTYRTHKNHELLILKNSKDKDYVEDYITEKL